MCGDSHVALITTGGTIAGSKSESGIDATCSSKYLMDVLNKSQYRLPDNIKSYGKDVFCLLSENMHPYLWGTIAEKAAEAANEGANGIIITHGTYTMAYTAAALSFMLQNLNIPVVMTGAQKLLDDENPDGLGNLKSSFILASDKTTPAKTLIVFSASPEEVRNYFDNLKINNKQKNKYNISNQYETIKYNGDGHFIFSGCRVKKYHSSREDAFQSDSVIGLIENCERISFLNGCKINRKKKGHDAFADIKIENKVALIKSHPGVDPQIIDILIDRGYKGIIIEGYGDGIVSTGAISPNDQYSFINSIKRATEMGIGVFMTSQTIGAATLSEYKGGPLLRRAGAVPLGDMTTECAIVKLMWSLGHQNDLAEVKKLMQKSICGEITYKSWQPMRLKKNKVDETMEIGIKEKKHVANNRKKLLVNSNILFEEPEIAINLNKLKAKKAI